MQPDIVNFTDSVSKREKEVKKIEKEKNVVEDQVIKSVKVHFKSMYLI